MRIDEAMFKLQHTITTQDDIKQGVPLTPSFLQRIAGSDESSLWFSRTRRYFLGDNRGLWGRLALRGRA